MNDLSNDSTASDTAPTPLPPHELLQFFRYDHLPAHLQPISKPFALLALEINERRPHNCETTKALDHLLHAKDAAVRAVLYRASGDPKVLGCRHQVVITNFAKSERSCAQCGASVRWEDRP